MKNSFIYLLPQKNKYSYYSSYPSKKLQKNPNQNHTQPFNTLIINILKWKLIFWRTEAEGKVQSAVSIQHFLMLLLPCYSTILPYSTILDHQHTGTAAFLCNPLNPVPSSPPKKRKKVYSRLQPIVVDSRAS